MRRTLFSNTALAGLAAIVMLAGCTVHKEEAPSLTGPSSLGTSLVVTVSPDVLSQDGASQSLVQIQASDSNGQPARSKSMRVDIAVDGSVTDFGKLSAKSVVTDSSGRASTTYTAPSAVLGITSTVTVTIVVTPSEVDFGNSTPRTVKIRVVPTGVVGPPTSPFIPTFSSPSPTVGNAATFTGTFSGESANATVATYVWDFGDGDTSVGQTVQHTYNRPGNFVVTLGLIDTLGRVNSVSQNVAVGQGTLPTASFNFSPSSPSINQTINFNASGSTAEAGHSIVDYSWNWGDGTTGSGPLATHAYSDNGSYTVTLKVTDDAGRKSGLTSQTVSVGVGGPTATFTFSPSSPSPGQSVNFDASQSRATSGRTITSYAWIFDDGTTGSGVNPTHAFAAGGSYVVRLTVTDNQGQTGTTTTTVSVNTNTPSASYTFTPSSPLLNQTISFNASASSAPSGRTLVSYAWNFGDGTTAGGVTTTHAFTAAGAYTVQLTVTDNIGQTGTTTQTITVSAGGPTASFTVSPTSPIVGQVTTFNASGSTAQTGRTIVTYAWNFGDGTTGSGVSPTHAFAASGSFTVQLTVTDNAGQTGQTTTSVSVSNATAPTASFTFVPPSPVVAGQTVTFNASNSSAGTGRSIASYSWDFGDGTPAGTGLSPTHSYATAGTYQVSLIVTDNGSPALTGSTSQSINVQDDVAVINITSGTSGTAGTLVTVTFDGSSSTAPSGRTIVGYSWSFSNGGTATGVTTSHDFLAPVLPGTQSYSVTLTVTDNVGHTNTVIRTFTVTGT